MRLTSLTLNQGPFFFLSQYLYDVMQDNNTRHRPIRQRVADAFRCPTLSRRGGERGEAAGHVGAAEGRIGGGAESS